MANKTDLVNKVQELLVENEFNVSKKEATLIVDTVLDGIETLTIEDGKLQLIGHGNYEVRERAARKGRNPQTGEEIEIAASKVPAFKAGKKFKDKVKNK